MFQQCNIGLVNTIFNRPGHTQTVQYLIEMSSVDLLHSFVQFAECQLNGDEITYTLDMCPGHSLDTCNNLY